MVVHELFECANDQPNVTTYKAFGSTNLTSDYDLTILGPNAPGVIERMSKVFKMQYNTSLPKAFDSNIYCTGFYSTTKSNPHIPGKIVAIDKGNDVGLFSVEAVDSKTRALQKRFALLKIYEADKNLFAQMVPDDRVAAPVRSLEKALQSELQKSKGEDKIEKMYTMLIKRAKKYFQKMYGRKEYTPTQAVSLFENGCAAGWASVEAYYTPASVAVVVLELQAGYTFQNAGGRPVVLQKHTYKCAALENFGDFVHHAKDLRAGSDLRHILLKLSKYIYRVEHCLEKISGQTMFAQRIKDGIVAHRGSGDTQKANWVLLRDQVGEYTSLADYIRRFAGRIVVNVG